MGRKRRNTDISDIKLSCKKRKPTSPSPLTAVESNEILAAQVESLDPNKCIPLVRVPQTLQLFKYQMDDLIVTDYIILYIIYY